MTGEVTLIDKMAATLMRKPKKPYLVSAAYLGIADVLCLWQSGEWT